MYKSMRYCIFSFCINLANMMPTNWNIRFYVKNEELVELFECLKVHKNDNFFGFDFEICTFS
jgi:hypothetical protein